MRHRIFLILFLLLLCPACGFRPQRAAPSGEFFVPPTAVEPTPEPTNTPAPLPTQAENNTSCSNSLTFISDLTIPDGTEVNVSVTMDKRWEVENSGSCAWDERYQIRLIAGSDYGAGQQQALPPARSGTRATIRILFTSPNQPGTYRSAWQAYAPDGSSFGDPFYIEFIVK